MASVKSVTATGNAEIDGLLAGTKWSGTVTYSFPDSPSDYIANYGAGEPTAAGFSQIPAAEQAAINYAVALISGYTNLTIQYAGTNSADIAVAQSSAANPTSYAYYPSSNAAGGDVWFGTAYNYSAAALGNYYFTTALHELGHAFGLKHSQETGGVANVAVPTTHDDLEFTVMSYRSYVGGPLTGYTDEAYGYPQTYMANDILALQTLYGANYATHSENTVYSWSPTTGQEFINGVGQLAPGGGAGGSANRVFMTVWDGNGVDTYDLSNYTTAVSINLNPGASSVTSSTQLAYLGSGHYAQGNIFNAYLYNGDARSYIDNANGGSGNDTIAGNAVGNVLNGGAGNDTLIGGGGNDTIIGGAGIDTAVFSGAKALYAISYNAATQTFTVADQRAGSPDGIDTVTGVENFQFTDGVVASSSLITVNHAPVLTLAGDPTVNTGQVLQASSLFSATDADGDALTYTLYDNTPAASSGHFAVNGVVVPAQNGYVVTAAQLAQTVFVAGAAGTSDDLMVQVSDGHVTTAWSEFHVNVVNHAPVLTLAGDPSVNTGQVLRASSLFSAIDADGDALTYTLYDNTPAASSGHFAVNGVVVPAQNGTTVSAAQLAQTVFVAGAAGTSDDLMVQVSDGHVTTAWSEFHVNVVNHAPVLTLAGDPTVNTGQVLQASSLFSATDADGDALTYTLYDNTPAAGSGHFVVNGVIVPAQNGYTVSAVQLAQTVFVAGAAGTSDDLMVQLSDGHVTTAWSEFHVNVIDHAPVLTLAPDSTVNTGQVLQASSLFSAIDADGDALTYTLYDNTPAAGSGHFVVNGVIVPAQNGYTVTAAQLAQTVFVAGAAGTSDDLMVQVSDGHVTTAWSQFHVNVVDHAPVLTLAPDPTVNTGQVLQASSLFSATDADGDALTYTLYDNTPDAGSGHFAVNGVVVPAQNGYTVSAAQLAQTTFIAGAAGTSDDLMVQVSDGHVTTTWSEFHVNVIDHAPSNETFSGGVIAENSPDGTVVGTVTGSDPDAGAVLTYSLIDDADGRFLIDSHSGQLTVADSAHLDYEAASSLGIVVHVADQFGLGLDKPFTVQLTDVPGVTLNGDGGNNTLTGTPEPDSINGLGGNDVLTGGGGNDTIDGGPGTDTAMFSGNRADYQVAYDPATQIFTVADQRPLSPDGTDSISHVEQFHFADGASSFAFDGGGNLVSDTFNAANGTARVDAFDTAGTQPWTWTVSDYDAQGHLTAQSGLNDDGTHFLTINDVNNQYSWSSATLHYDTAWNETSVSGSRDDGSHAVTMGDVQAAYDTTTWYATTFDTVGPAAAHGGHTGTDYLVL